MGNKTSTQAWVFEEKSKRQQKNFKNEQKQRRKQKQQKKLKLLRGGANDDNNNHDNIGDHRNVGGKGKGVSKESKVSRGIKGRFIGSKARNTTVEIIRQNQQTKRPNTPLLEPKIEENVSDIEEPEIEENDHQSMDLNDLPNQQEEEAPSLTEYLAKGEVATSPTATDSSYDRSFGMDSFDSTSSPQKQFVFDTIALNSSHATTSSSFSSGPMSSGSRSSSPQGNIPVPESENGNEQYDNDYHQEDDLHNKLPSSRLFSIQESASAGDNTSSSPETSIHNNNNNKNIDATLNDSSNINDNHDDNSYADDDNDISNNGDDGDDNDQYSDTSSQHENLNMFHGIDDESLGGSESLLSQGSCSEFDNMSKGVISISEKSLSSIPSIIMKNKQYQRNKHKNQQDKQLFDHHNDCNSIAPLQTSQSFNSSSSSLSPTNHSQNFSSSRSVISCTDLSIHSRRTKVKRSKSDNSPVKRPTRPTATNAFETLPRHLIKTGLVRQTAATLRDERFLKRRIEKLGPEYASKVHASDFELLQKRDRINAERRERIRDVEGEGLEAELPSAQSFPDGDDFFSVMMDSFDLFLKCILEMCAVTLRSSIFEVGEGCDDLLEEGDEESCDDDDEEEEEKDEEREQIEEEEMQEEGTEQEIDSVVDEQENIAVQEEPLQDVEPKMPREDGGKALFTLGKFLQDKGWIDDAMFYFRHALYLCLLECDVDEPRLMDEAEDCEGLFYDDIATRGTMEPSVTHEILGTILIKMGDVHGKNLEINDALRAYRASQIFWSTYLSNHKVSNEENYDDKDDDLDELTDYTASVEGLALTHNRVGGVYTSKGDLPSALESFHEALELQIDALGDDHLEVAKTLHNIGVCHRHNDEWDEALEFYTRAHIIFEKVLGKHHLDTARTLHNIGGVYRRKRMYQEALECFKQVLFTRRKLLGDDHPSVSIALVSIGAALRRSGRKEEANKFYAAAVR